MKLLLILSMLSALLGQLETHTLQATYSLSVSENAAEPINYPGQIILRGERFELTMVGTQAAYDGKTLSIYQEDTDELTLSNPTREQLLAANPLLYAQHLASTCRASERDSKDGKKTIITLLPNEQNGTLTRCVVQVRKSDTMLLSVELTEGKRVTRLSLNNPQYTTAEPSGKLHVEGAYVNDMR